MRETEDYYLFWKHQFGQWTLRDIVDLDGTVYNCCEQYMMAKKALLFNDIETYEKIMDESLPNVQQELGRFVCNFEQKIWDENKYGIVWFANFLKFSQHQDLKDRLLATGNKTLAEASPHDPIWGIGLHEDDDAAMDESKWLGQNLLGDVLMSVRKALGVSISPAIH